MNNRKIRSAIVLVLLFIAAVIILKLTWSIIMGLLKIAVALGVIAAIAYFAYIFIKKINNPTNRGLK